MTLPRRLGRNFFRRIHQSPISRIGPLLLVSVLAGGCDNLGLDDKSPTAPGGPPAAGSTIVYDVIGASDANGVGSSVPCLPFTDCPDGMGYAPVAARDLKSRGFDVSLVNLGIPTAVISAAFQALGQQYGRFIAGNFIAQEMPFVRTNATLVTIFAGGNEVNTITAALGAGAGAGNPAGYIDSQVAAFASDFATLVSGVRSRAGTARLVALNVPNLAALPLFSGSSLAQRQAAERASAGMAGAVNAFRGQNVTIVDVMCDSRSYLPSNYSSDGFHPNDAGHAYIASEIVRAVTASAYPAPQASCAFMSVVPPM